MHEAIAMPQFLEDLIGRFRPPDGRRHERWVLEVGPRQPRELRQIAQAESTGRAEHAARLDLEPRWVRAARERGIRFVISTDAHATGELRNLRYGVAMARRGWVRRGEVLNALPEAEFRRAVRPGAAA
jgi:histidinol phosphatase-like PHP family hydrolase